MSEEKLVDERAAVVVEQLELFSEFLERELIIDIYLPARMNPSVQYSLLLINDGQDLPKMPFDSILSGFIETGVIEPLIAVGIYCGEDRKMEYGTAYAPDYLGRGARAGLYTKFIFDELLPFLRKHLQITSFKDKSFAGFSLGALSALDIVWNHPNQFNKIGVFSGSLWWRRKAYDEGYDDEQDRLMHLQIRKADFYPWIKFFFQCGALDETADRNNNGIIDSIDDTLDLIVELKAKGYTEEHIHYLLLENGKHDVPTWGNAFPAFLKWAYKSKK
ncbi:MAG: esterase [Chitinophagaceae bacterium]|nr:esterase [Chitinophagaceae bacterium]